MDSFIIDEVDELLKLKKGESNRLNQIKQLCEAKKLIPISDRKYVERLASQYLYKKEEVKIKDQNFQNIQSEQNMTHEDLPKNEKEIVTNKETAQIIEEPVPPSRTEKAEKSSLFILISNKKIVLGIAAIVLSIVLISVVVYNGNMISFPEIEEKPPSTNLVPPYILLVTDEPSYMKEDIISISGESNPIITGKIRVTIENPEGEVIWAENLQVKDNGEFSTLLIAAGKGWEKSGQYELISKHESLESKVTFDVTE